jgi:hypothetical protein
VFCLSALCSAESAEAQTGKVPVFFEVQANDPVGQQLSFTLKDKIRASATFSEAGREQDSVFIVSFVTLDPSSSNSGQDTIYAFDVLMENTKGLNYFVTQYVGICSIDRVPNCADNLYRYLGEELERLKQLSNQHPNS